MHDLRTHERAQITTVAYTNRFYRLSSADVTDVIRQFTHSPDASTASIAVVSTTYHCIYIYIYIYIYIILIHVDCSQQRQVRTVSTQQVEGRTDCVNEVDDVSAPDVQIWCQSVKVIHPSSKNHHLQRNLISSCPCSLLTPVTYASCMLEASCCKLLRASRHAGK